MLYYFFSCGKRFSKTIRKTEKETFFSQILKVQMLLEHFLFMKANKNKYAKKIKKNPLFSVFDIS